MIHHRNKDGRIPLHNALCWSGLSAARILFEVGGQDLVRIPVEIPVAVEDDENNPPEDDPIAPDDEFDGYLPLHFHPICSPYQNYEAFLRSSHTSESTELLRMMLRWYPEAAGIVAGKGDRRKSPYQLAVDNQFPPYYLRMLLRAAPDHNPAELYRLNFAERRMAMFLAFRAVSKDVKPLFLARLRFENKDLVKHIVLFL